MTRRIVMVFIVILIHLVFYQTSFAADTSKVSLNLLQDTSVSAGQRYSFSITLLTAFQFDGPTYFDLPEIENAVIMQVSERPIFGTEEINDESYVSASYDFAVFAQRGGSLTIPPITARFGSKPAYDQPAIEHQLQTKSFEIKVAAPSGAIAGEVIVSSSEFSATQTWSANLEKVKVGDAITRTISISAQEVPAMLLPPPNFNEVQGLALYSKSPQLKDKTERGEFTGERVDTVTYICEQPGLIEIPELSLRWWDPDKKQWQTKSFPAVTLEVADNPALAEQSASSGANLKPATAAKSWIGWIIFMLAFVAALVFAAKPLKRNWQAWRTRHAASEAVQWKRLRNACRGGDAAEIYRELNRWLSHYGLSSLQLTIAFSAGVSDRLRSNCVALQQRLAGLDTQWDAGVFRDEVTALRRYLRASIDVKTTRVLPPLNPM